MTSSNHPFSGVNSLLVSGSVHFNLISLILGYCVPLLMLPGEGQWHFAGRILEAFLTRWDLRPTGPPVPRNAVWFSNDKKAKGYLQYVFAFFLLLLSVYTMSTYIFFRFARNWNWISHTTANFVFKVLASAKALLQGGKNSSKMRKFCARDLSWEGCHRLISRHSGWWFQIFFIFTPTWGWFPIPTWLL